MTQPFYSDRITVKEDPDGISISIPAMKNGGTLSIMGIWLFFWALVEYMGFAGWSNGEEGEPDLLFFIPWTAGGLFFLFIFIWFMFGREIMQIRLGEMRIVKKIATFERALTYNLYEISNLRLYLYHSPKSIPGRGNGTFGGGLQFDYQGKTIRFGNGLEQAEAQALIDWLRRGKYLNEKNFSANA